MDYTRESNLLPYIFERLDITDREIKILVDTGAEISLIKLGYISEYCRDKIHPPPLKLIQGIGVTETIQPVGIIHANIHNVITSFFIVKDNEIFDYEDVQEDEVIIEEDISSEIGLEEKENVYSSANVEVIEEVFINWNPDWNPTRSN